MGRPRTVANHLTCGRYSQTLATFLSKSVWVAHAQGLRQLAYFLFPLGVGGREDVVESGGELGIVVVHGTDVAQNPC